MSSFHVVVAFVVFLQYVQGETCTSPSYKSNVYTTSESTVSEHTVFIVEFTLACKNNVQEMNLYAEMSGVTIPASKVEATNKYQVSFTAPHKELPAAFYPVRVFDEEGYGDLKKAQRTGEDQAKVKSLFTIEVSHQGASSGPWLDSVFVATCLSGLLVYFAHTHKQSLEQS